VIAHWAIVPWLSTRLGSLAKAQDAQSANSRSYDAPAFSALSFTARKRNRQLLPIYTAEISCPRPNRADFSRRNDHR
jgi:hypothetical protein